MSDKSEWFREWFNSPYYHKLYSGRDDDEAAKFINKLISFLSPPANAYMIDVACGKGRHAKVLASHGFDVTGIDLSENSIAFAKKYETANLHFFVHDMRLPFWINYFDYAFNFFTSFGYFNTKREHENTLRTVAQSLKPGGCFVIDYLNAAYAVDHFVSSGEIIKDGIKFRITKSFDEKHFYKKIIIEDEEKDEPVVFNEMITKFSREDFTQMLHRQQMEVQQAFGDYELNEYDEKRSPRIILIAKKKSVS